MFFFGVRGQTEKHLHRWKYRIPIERQSERQKNGHLCIHFISGESELKSNYLFIFHHHRRRCDNILLLYSGVAVFFSLATAMPYENVTLLWNVMQKKNCHATSVLSLRGNRTSPSIVAVVAVEHEFGLAERKNLIMCKTVCICFALLLYLHPKSLKHFRRTFGFRWCRCFSSRLIQLRELMQRALSMLSLSLTRFIFYFFFYFPLYVFVRFVGYGQCQHAHVYNERLKIPCI